MTNAERDALVESYDYLVTALAARVMREIPRRHERSDLEQEGRIALIEAVEQRYEACPASFTSYLKCRLRGAMLDFVQKHDQVREIQDSPAPEPAVSPDTVVSIRAAVAHLPSEERRVIEQTYFAEQTQAMVADEMGISQVRVCQRHRSALRRLRPQLSQLEAAA